MTHKIKGLVLLFMIILVVGSLAACTAAQPSSSPSGIKAGSGSLAIKTPVPSKSSAVTTVTPQNKVSGTGTIDAANYANLNFGSAGQVIAINVKKGDHVTRDAVLAKLDTADLEVALAQAKVAQGQSSVLLTQAKTGLDQAKLAQVQANTALAAAQFNLDRTAAVKDIQDEISKLQRQIEVSKQMMAERIALNSEGSADYYLSQIKTAQAQLIKQQKDLLDLLTGSETGTVMAGVATYEIGGQEYDRLVVQDVRMKELAVEVAQNVVDQTATGITLAQLGIDQANNGLVLAQKNLDLIKKHIDQSTIAAPFDGLVAGVNPRVGDFITIPAALPKPVIFLIDPASLELVIAANELDVPRVKIGQKAAVSIDAFPDIKLDGQVSAISSVPTLHGSVVDYDITITFPVPSNMEVKVGMNAAAVITAE